MKYLLATILLFTSISAYAQEGILVIPRETPKQEFNIVGLVENVKRILFCQAQYRVLYENYSKTAKVLKGSSHEDMAKIIFNDAKTAEAKFNFLESLLPSAKNLADNNGYNGNLMLQQNANIYTGIYGQINASLSNDFSGVLQTVLINSTQCDNLMVDLSNDIGTPVKKLPELKL